MNISIPPPPPYETIANATSANKNKRIQELINKYEIDPLFSEKLNLLSDFEIVLLLDDSGSMNTPLTDGSGHATRWDELKSVVNIVISIATIFDDDGIDVHFLNRENTDSVKDLNQVTTIMNDPPQGLTPLTSSLNKIFIKYRDSIKPVLVIIATDGVPYNGVCDLDNFKNLLLKKNHSKFFVSFLACSDNDKDIDYLNDLDKNVPNVDTLDDYNSEKKEVLKVQGSQFNYSFADHVCRLLLGPICEELDLLDEYRLDQLDKERNFRCKCTIL